MEPNTQVTLSLPNNRVVVLDVGDHQANLQDIPENEVTVGLRQIFQTSSLRFLNASELRAIFLEALRNTLPITPAKPGITRAGLFIILASSYSDQNLWTPIGENNRVTNSDTVGEFNYTQATLIGNGHNVARRTIRKKEHFKTLTLVHYLGEPVPRVPPGEEVAADGGEQVAADGGEMVVADVEFADGVVATTTTKTTESGAKHTLFEYDDDVEATVGQLVQPGEEVAADGGEMVVADVEFADGVVATTTTKTTESGAKHTLFEYDDDVEATVGQLVQPGEEVAADGGEVVVADVEFADGVVATTTTKTAESGGKHTTFNYDEDEDGDDAA